MPIPGDLPASATSYTWTGLAPGTEYDLSVRSFGPAGQSAPVTSRVRTAVPPVAGPARPRPAGHDPAADQHRDRARRPQDRYGAQRAPRRPGDGQAQLAGADVRRHVTGYRIVGYRLDRKGHLTKTVTSDLIAPGKLRTTVRMPRGRYRLAVVAIGPAGTGPQSARSPVVSVR